MSPAYRWKKEQPRLTVARRGWRVEGIGGSRRLKLLSEVKLQLFKIEHPGSFIHSRVEVLTARDAWRVDLADGDELLGGLPCRLPASIHAPLVEANGSDASQSRPVGGVGENLWGLLGTNRGAGVT
jgi:hypothetical protein